VTEPQAGGGPQGPPPDFARLARRDVQVFVGGTIVALVLLLALAVSRVLGSGERFIASLAVVIGMVVGAGALAWWLAGPRELRRARFMVLAPTSLCAGPVLLGFAMIGAGPFAIVISSAFGFGAAIAGGLALSSRRSR
jgi:hypothetical protein